MSLQHGTQPTTKPNKKPSAREDDYERKRGVKPTLPPRDSSVLKIGVTKKHHREDKK